MGFNAGGSRNGPAQGGWQGAVVRESNPPCGYPACVRTGKGEPQMGTVRAYDGTELYYKDWGEGPVVMFSHGWPLSADAWDGQMIFLAWLSGRGDRHGLRDP